MDTNQESSAKNIIKRLAGLGASLSVEQGKLKLHAKKGTVDVNLQRDIKDNKEAILNLLQSTQKNEEVVNIEPVDRTRPLPLSYSQQRLWFLDQLEGANATYNIPSALFLYGAVDSERVEQSIQYIVDRHEILRTTYQSSDQGAHQKVEFEARFTLEKSDLSDEYDKQPEADKLNFIKSVAKAYSREVFDLSVDIALRVKLIKVDVEIHVLLINMHHIASDGWSTGILIEEFIKLYLEGENALPALKLQYGDFASWQRKHFDESALEQYLDFWGDTLAGVDPILSLPFDKPRPSSQQFIGEQLSVKFDVDLINKLQSVAKSNDASLYMVMLAAFQYLLAYYSRSNDIAVGTPVANRNNPQIEPLIGFFVNTLVIRTEVDSSNSFTKLLSDVKTIVLDAMMHSQVPFEKVVDHIAPERSLGYQPFFQNMFSLLNKPMNEANFESFKVKKIELDSGVAKFDLHMSLVEGSSGVEGFFEYSTALFERSSIERMLDHYIKILREISEVPDLILKDISFVKEEELSVLDRWNENDHSLSHDNVHSFFEAQADRSPEDVALVCKDGTTTSSLTYSELESESNKVANFLMSAGVRIDDPVGVSVARSNEMIIAMLGILKSGGCYVALDPGYPVERLQAMIEDSGLSTLIADQASYDRLAPSLSENIQEKAVVFIRGSTVPWNGCADSRLDLSIPKLSSAYITFTSGSTGRPKGSLITHGGLSNLLQWQLSHYDISKGEACLQYATINFDVSFQEIFGTLGCGGKLVITTDEQRHDTSELINLLNQEKVSFLFCPVVVLQQLAEHCKHVNIEPKYLKVVTTAGDALRITKEIEWLFERVPEGELHNHYGPSETHVVTASKFTPDKKPWPALPHIGKAVNSNKLYIVDEHMNRVPPGIAGELLIGGDQLYRGYCGRPVQTAEVCIPDPFSKLGGSRLYKTGDLVRFLDDGDVQYLGRIDKQVKIRGFRVELGEIESVIAASGLVGNVVVLARNKDKTEEKHLVAYLVLDESGQASTNEKSGAICRNLKECLAKKLPDYMRPSHYVYLDEIPQTKNGKIDRNALPEPKVGEDAYLPPQTEMEFFVAAQYEDVLGVSNIGREGHFFELGGHSLKATKLVTRLREELVGDFSVQLVFEYPRVLDLAKIIDGSPKKQHIKIELASRTEKIPLSYSQQRLWFLNQLEGSDSITYSMPLALRIEGKLDSEKVSLALDKIVNRHEILRTTFTDNNGEGIQVIHDHLSPEIRHIEVSVDLGDKVQKEKEIKRRVEEEISSPFDLVSGPLLRVSILSLSESQSVFVFNMHHIISDGWSINNLCFEFCSLYENQEVELSGLGLQYADFSVWQRHWLESREAKEQLDYWRGYLTGIPDCIDFPTDHKRPPVQSYRGKRIDINIDNTLKSELESFSKANNVSLFMTLITAFSVLIYRWSDEKDIVIGSALAGRTRTELEPLIGFFANLWVLRSEVSGDQSFEDLLTQVKVDTLRAYSNQMLPFDLVVDALKPDRSLAFSPIFQIMFLLHNNENTSFKLEGLSASGIDINFDIAKHDLTVNLWPSDDGIIGSFEYAVDLFDDSSIKHLVDEYVSLLKQIVFTKVDQLDNFELEFSEGSRKFDNTLYLKGLAQYFQRQNVSDCALVHKKGDNTGVTAYIASANDPHIEALTTHIKHGFPSFLHPREIVPVSHIPLTKNGAIDEKKLLSTRYVPKSHLDRENYLLEQSLPGVNACYASTPITESGNRIHLSDITPGWRWLTQGSVVDDVLTPTSENKNPSSFERRPDAYVSGGVLENDDSPQTLTEALQRTASNYRVKGINFVFINGERDFLSYPDLLQQACQLLHGFQEQGLSPGDAVILQLENNRSHLISFWACVLGGFRPVTVSIAPSYSQKNGVSDKLFNIWGLLGSPLILTSESLKESLGALPELYQMDCFSLDTFESLLSSDESGEIYTAKPEDVVFYQLTSGSTGVPKCIQETHRGIIQHIRGSSLYCGYSSDDRSLNWLPMDHVVPILTFHLKDTYLGVSQFEVATSAVLHDPLLWLDLIEEYAITHSWSPNFGYNLVAEALAENNAKERDLSSLKILMNAGEQVTLPVVEKFLTLLAPFGVEEKVMQPSFGMAEACTCMTYQNEYSVNGGVRYFKKTSLQSDLVETSSDDKSGIGFIDLGGVIPGVEIRIADENNQLIQEGQIGRFQIRGAVITPGYYLNEEANEAAFVDDDWFDSGDLGFILDGRLTLTGRAKETIIVNGANFYCYEIEDVVNSVEGVSPTFSAAVSVNDEESGTENLVVFFCPEESAEVCVHTITRIKGEVTRVLGVSPSYVIPIHKKDFPKTTSGKIQRVQLKKALLAGEYSGRLKEIDIAQNSSNVIPSWFYQERWVNKSLTFKDDNVNPGAHVFFTSEENDYSDLFNLLIEQGVDIVEIHQGEKFVKKGSNTYCVNPRSVEDLTLLLADLEKRRLSPRNIVFDWYATREDYQKDSPAYLREALEQGVFFLKPLLINLKSKLGEKEALRLFVTSSHGLAGNAPNDFDFASGYLQGWLSAVKTEIPMMDTAMISLHSGEPNRSSIVKNELSQVFIEDILYSDGKRLCRRFEEVVLTNNNLHQGPRPGAYYVATGGLGGIGYVVCQWLLNEFDARLLIVGRSELVPGTSRQERFTKLQKISKNVIFRKLDLQDEQGLDKAITSAASSFGQEIDGVFHFSGLYSEDILENESDESLAAAIDAKVFPAFHLFNILVRKRGKAGLKVPGLFVNMSSALAYFPAAGISTYSATNAFLNSFTQYQNLDHGTPIDSFSLVSSNWNSTGMSSDIPFKSAVEKRGFHFMQPDHAMASIKSVLCQTPGVWMFGVDMYKPALRSSLLKQSTQVLQPSLFIEVASEETANVNEKIQSLNRSFLEANSVNLISVEKLPYIQNGIVKEGLDSSSNLSGTFSTKIEPKTSTERKLVALWKEVLSLEAIGTNENFFELGGNSMLAVNLLGRINKEFSKDIDLAKLFHAQTVLDLAEILEEDHAEQWNPIVALNSKGNRTPLFMIHPGGGWVTNYQLLTSLLSDEQPVYGVQARGTVPGLRSHENIEEMSIAYAEAICNLLEKNDSSQCMVGGWSLGAVIAFETVKQLQARGIDAGKLLLVDSAPHPFDEDEIKILDDYDDVDMLAHLSETLLPQKDKLYELSADERLNFVYQHLLSEGEVPPGAGVEHLESLRDEALSNARIRRRGVTSSTINGVKTLLVISSEVKERSKGIELLGWNDYIESGITVFDVVGRHENLMTSPCVEKIASAIEGFVSDTNHTM